MLLCTSPFLLHPFENLHHKLTLEGRQHEQVGKYYFHSQGISEYLKLVFVEKKVHF